MTAAALIISIVAIAAAVGMWLVDKGGRDRDRDVRRREREQDRTERAAERDQDRRERHAERNDVLLDVALVTREAAGRSDGRAQYWWRLRIVGGTAFSRATVYSLGLHHPGDSPQVWEPFHKEVIPLTIGAGQTVYLPGYEPTIAEVTVQVRTEWAPAGEQRRLLERSVIDQPD